MAEVVTLAPAVAMTAAGMVAGFFVSVDSEMKHCAKIW